MKNARLKTLSLLFVLLFASQCAPVVKFVGIKLFYKESDANETRILPNLAYKTNADADNIKHKLDLYLPPGKNWPTLIFVHGGGWTSGDKNLRVSGADIYGNIGRFFASRGIAVAVVNYRLLPDVTVEEQVQDVADASAWVYKNISRYNGDSKKIYLSGHSAGAQLVTRLALDAIPLRAHKLAPTAFKGVISVSGAALDLLDEETYKLGGQKSYFRKRFEQDENTAWEQKASPLLNFTAKYIPSFLVLYGNSESDALKRQSRLLFDAVKLKSSSWIFIAENASHELMVLLMSRKNNMVTDSILDFIRATSSSQSR